MDMLTLQCKKSGSALSCTYCVLSTFGEGVPISGRIKSQLPTYSQLIYLITLTYDVYKLSISGSSALQHIHQKSGYEG